MKKREYILSINPCIYGLNYHDPGAAIISDGEILFAIEEERLNGIKGSKGVFPELSIKTCLDYCGIDKNQISCITIGYNPELWMKRLQLELDNIIDTYYENKKVESKRIMNRIIDSNLVDRYKFYIDIENVKNLIVKKIGIDGSEIKFYDHHMSHIASSYECSQFTDAVGIVVDGIGECECTTIWEIHDHLYSRIETINYPNSLGYFYAIATKFLGFEPWHHEGKTMALAAYGQKDDEIYDKLEQVIDLEQTIYDVGQFIYSNSTNYLMIDEEMALQSLEKLVGFSRRCEGEPIEQKYIDFAWAVQNILERAVVNLVNYATSKTGIKNVCVAGGIFMNCKMNMVVREKANLKAYFVQPLAGDMGLVIGAGLLASSMNNVSELSLDLGPEYKDEEIEMVLKNTQLAYVKDDDIARSVAKLIAEQKIVCWFEGRMESGARALGNRSILADPRTIEMSDKINEQVKHREVWRPFACSVLEEYCEDIFENYSSGSSYPFMIEAFKVKKKWINRIPAVIHKIDKTSRPQTVSKKNKPLYYAMIDHFRKITGCPLVLNTSFNDRGQPIVMSPKLAVEFLMNNQVDALAIGNYLVYKK